MIGHFLDLRIVQNLGKIYIVRGNELVFCNTDNNQEILEIFANKNN